MVSTSDIRERFLAYFAEHDHTVVPSSPLVPGNDRTLLFTNSGMVQFKDVFTGEESRDYVRAVTSQRCVRAGGKHNDLDNVGYTARHHTFFEMLGNFSFGDYFKDRAIRLAWDFLTERLGLPPEKLWVTVFEEDDEAERIWVEEIGLPAERVIRIGAKDNFWAMGDTGPCGPCSEIFYDHGPEVEGGPPGSPDEDGDRYIEIWNLVFMQYERAADGTMTPLPKPSIDTGMGLERIAAVLQGVHSNYETDLFERLIDAAARAIGTAERDSPSLRVVADHIRSCAFLIVDGVQPGNEGRGYVLRRIIRRAARHGHKLGAAEPFFHRLVEPLAAEMGAAYPELAEAAPRVAEQLLREEERFAETLASGMRILDEAVADLESGGVIPGEVVFKLYDTYGFPADLTADIARERALVLDMAGYEREMDAQRERARAEGAFAGRAVLPTPTLRAVIENEMSGSAELMPPGASGTGCNEAPTVTTVTTGADGERAARFVGYERDSVETRLLAVVVGGERVERIETGQEGVLILERTPFYAEAGGQVGDTGTVEAAGGTFVVHDTQKELGAQLHIGRLERGALVAGDAVVASIDAERRARIRAHHSATHLLHGALRHVLGAHVEQKGSLVADEHLRFDFSHEGPIGEDEIAAIERWIDREVRANHPRETIETDIDSALAMGAIALFGEKYGKRVRVVKLGENSVELCGGTHVAATGELGAVRLLGEGGVAAGIRRVEAVAGEAALARVQGDARELAEIALLMKAPRAEVVARVRALLERNRELARTLERAEARLASSAGRDLAAAAEPVEGIPVLTRVVGEGDAKALRSLVDRLRQEIPGGILVLGGEKDGKASLVAAVDPALHDRVTAGELLSRVASALGGRGGGRPDLAQGGAPSLAEADAAFGAAREWLGARLAQPVDV